MASQAPSSPPGIPSAATADSAQYISANSVPETVQGPSGEHPPPIATTQLKLTMGPDMVAYLVDPLTGQRFDVEDDEDISESAARPWAPLSRDATTDADGTPSTTLLIGDKLPLSGEALVSALATDLSAAPLSEQQLAKLSRLRSMFSMSRDALLSTTGLVAGQHTQVDRLAERVTSLRDEMSLHIEELSDEVIGASHRLESTLENNLRVLRITGATESELKLLAETVRQNRSHPVAPIQMHTEASVPIAPPTDLGNLKSALNNALPPMQPHESPEDFHRRGNNTIERKMRAAASFDTVDARDPRRGIPPHMVVPPATNDSASMVGTNGRGAFAAPPHKATQFAGVEGASAMGARAGYYGPLKVAPMGLNQSLSGYLTQPVAAVGHATVFEVFVAEKSSQISRLIERQLGEPMEAPPRSPKMRDPPQYKGEDDDTIFMSWLGKICTWFQGHAMAGPKYDANRIVFLKTALESHVLEWFQSEVEPLDKESTIIHEFEEIVCALHKRFVTSATATRATKEFEAVRYDASRGVEFLASELLRTAAKMREPPADFTVRQRFMKLLPADVHDVLIGRSLHPEFTDLDTLKSHARVRIEGLGAMRGSRTTSGIAAGVTTVSRAPAPLRSPARGVQTCAATRAAADRTATRPAGAVTPCTFLPPRSSIPTTSPSVRFAPPPSAMPNRSGKTCYGCGTIGHIASDPSCPRFNESASSRPRPAAQLHAQRVDDSHSVGEGGDNILEDEELEYEDQEVEVTWGGDQYEADELIDVYDYPADQGGAGVDVHEAPDLSDLIDRTEEPSVRVGAMRQYYSMRVDRHVPLEEVPEGVHAPDLVHPTVRNRTLILDADVTLVSVADDSTPTWTAEGEAALEESRGIGWDTGVTSPDALFVALEEHYGSRVHDARSTAEILAIEALSAEEHARESWEGLLMPQPVMIRGFSPESTAIDPEVEVALVGPVFRGLQQILIDLHGLIGRRLDAKRTIRSMSRTIVDVQSRAPSLLARAAMANRRLLDDMRMSAHLLKLRLVRVNETLRALQEEATRRSMEREGYRLTRASGQPPVMTPLGNAEPPRYPGSPRESDHYYSAEDLPELSQVPDLGSEMGDEVDIPSSESSIEFTVDGNPGAPESEGMAITLPLPDDDNNLAHSEEVILRSVEVLTSRDAERLTTLVSESGDLRVIQSALPDTHRLHPTFRHEHQAALAVAIVNHAVDTRTSVSAVEQWATYMQTPERDANGLILRDINGVPDHLPNLIPGLVYHEGLPSEGPEEDNESAWPEFRARLLSQRVEHLSSVRRPRSLPIHSSPESIGLMDQPSRSTKTIACLSAVVKIGSSSAYALFDSGSNTDSITPEYANAVRGVRIPLTEQVTLQLGCVGSRSKISFGTRLPVDFGGIRGHVYFDQVNLDRYDVVIGTPFMNKHGLVLDFGTREICFRNGHTIKALSSIEEASLVESRKATPRKPEIASKDGRTLRVPSA
ncbi:hypothetical protein K438DRAFT_1968524 [Mycena galopus ATCC 62051]|nr:hypothetical protein K438DRAFT_1968524 [Mycena galopus ATCC 62051]